MLDWSMQVSPRVRQFVKCCCLFLNTSVLQLRKAPLPNLTRWRHNHMDIHGNVRSLVHHSMYLAINYTYIYIYIYIYICTIPFG